MVQDLGCTGLGAWDVGLSICNLGSVFTVKPKQLGNATYKPQ